MNLIETITQTKDTDDKGRRWRKIETPDSNTDTYTQFGFRVISVVFVQSVARNESVDWLSVSEFLYIERCCVLPNIFSGC